MPVLLPPSSLAYHFPSNLLAARIIFFISLLLANPVHSQEFSSKKYSVKEGLPGLVVYHTVQDKKGLIWFATNRGVSRFDGKVFKNYSKEDGLPDNEIIKLYVDRHDNIWFISFQGIPSVLHNGSIHQIRCEGVLQIVEDLVGDSVILLSKLPIKGHETLGYYKSANRSGEWAFSAFAGGQHMSYPFSPVLRASTSNGVRFYFSYVDKKKSHLAVTDGNAIMKSYFGDTSFNPFTFSSFIHVAPNKLGIVYHTDDSVYYADVNGLRSLIYLGHLGLDVEKGTDVNFLYCENDSVLWLCTKTRGLIRIRNFMHPSRQIQYFFPKSYCSAILKDREGGYWITTVDDGVYYVPNLNFFNLVDAPAVIAGSVRCVRTIYPQELVAGFANGTILSVDLDSLKATVFSKWTRQNKNNRVMDIWPYYNNHLLVSSDRGLYDLTRNETYSGISTEQGVKGMYLKPDSTIVLGTATSMAIAKPGKIRPVRIYNDRVTCVASMGDTYVFGTLNGLHVIQHDSLISMGEKHSALKGFISHIAIAADSALWISTRDGIVVWKQDKLHTINKSQGLLSNRCKHVAFDSLTAWISTDQGISRINYQWTADKFSYTISNIMEVDGLLSSDVNQTAVGGGYVWAATEAGISFFSKDYRGSPYVLPPIIVNRILSGTKELPIADTVNLNYKKSNLRIELFCPSYRSCGNLHYEYRINELDSEWHATHNNFIEFSSLPFGEFELEVYAVNKWGQRNSSPKKITIINTPPFWKATWFSIVIYIVTFLLLAAVFYFFSRARHHKKEQSFKMTQRMRDLEIMALRAQMNPHFIFNCMSSIQYFILRADVASANMYLHKFSVLIRKILQYSNISTVSISDEIKLLELYLELEKMRFGERMEFRIIKNDIPDADRLFIPPMIIQPYIENAIKHGISPLQNKKGTVTISFERSVDYIHCTIDDNGIGINVSKQKSHPVEEDHQSMGNSITEHRIRTINSLQKNKILLKITDKQEINPADSGTFVHLSFPIVNE